MRASPMSLWLRSAKLRRAFALSAVVLATGGLVLYKAPSSAAFPSDPRPVGVLLADGKSSVAFSGPGAHGVLSLSHTKVLSGQTTPVYAEVRLVADSSESTPIRAPISLAVVLDTSGSMSGEKIEQAKNSVIQLLRDMRDDDEIAFVRYASDSEVVQPLARLGGVREQLIARVRELRADGGTNIPPAMEQGMRALAEAGRGRVRRVILASDGLDSSRAIAEKIAKDSANRGVTVSSMGIGLDFDEGYMGGVAQSGRGNFAFVKDASTLASFLGRELKETASTTIEGATARITLPSGVRLVRAIGAEATSLNDGREIELALGALFAGDERRVIVELAASMEDGQSRAFEGQIAWDRVGGDRSKAAVSGLALSGSSDAQAVEEGRDGAVYASAMSALASVRQVEAAAAYGRGDARTADALIEQNKADLRAAATAAPAAAATALAAQMAEYEETQRVFAAAPPASTAGKVAAKAAAAKQLSNMSRKVY